MSDTVKTIGIGEVVQAIGRMKKASAPIIGSKASVGANASFVKKIP